MGINKRTAMTDDGLTSLQAAFVAMYMATRNATVAYRLVHPDAKNASNSGYNMLKKKNVQRRIQYYLKLEGDYKMRDARAIEEELEKIAFFKITDVVAWDADSVTVKASSEIEMEAMSAIQDVDITETEFNGAKVLKVHVKTAEKLRALELLAKIKGMFKEDQPQAPEEKAPDLSVLTDKELEQYELIQEKLTAGGKEV